MRLKINGSQLPAVFMTLEKIGVADWTVRTDYNSGEIKLGLGGKPLHGTRKGVVVMGENGVDKTATFTVVEPVELQEMTKYRAEGDVYVTHYQNDSGRMAVSIQVEKLVPVK